MTLTIKVKGQCHRIMHCWWYGVCFGTTVFPDNNYGEQNVTCQGHSGNEIKKDSSETIGCKELILSCASNMGNVI